MGARHISLYQRIYRDMSARNSEHLEEKPLAMLYFGQVHVCLFFVSKVFI